MVYLDVLGALNTTRAFLPHFREHRGGTIVMISSVGAWSVPLGTTLYCATKAALSAIGEGLRKEVEHLGINVITVEPLSPYIWVYNPRICLRISHC